MSNRPLHGIDPNTKISARDFYSEFRGHRVEHLESLVHHLRNNFDLVVPKNDDGNNNNNNAINSTMQTNIIWTAGDSSLDNKYWFRNTVPAVSSYQHILQPPISKPDVTYWLNQTILLSSETQFLQLPEPSSATSTSTSTQKETLPSLFSSRPPPPQQQQRYVAVNGAVEASTLNIRTIQLLPQDQFIRDHIQEDDILIVSIGGNDVALLPLPCTVISILCLVSVCPTICTERGCIYGTIPVDDYCCSCGPSLWSCCCGCPPCLGYFRHLFGYRVQKYIEGLTRNTKPSKIVVCMIYYPDEQNDEATWANTTLQILGYNTNPNQLQTFIRKIFNDVITTIQIKDTEMIYVPLYRILDGTNTNDYVARVEPSVLGGKKMAEYLYANLFPSSSTSFSPPPSPSYQRYTPANTIPASSFIQDRD